MSSGELFAAAVAIGLLAPLRLTKRRARSAASRVSGATG